jgi:hypothetical protein
VHTATWDHLWRWGGVSLNPFSASNNSSKCRSRNRHLACYVFLAAFARAVNFFEHHRVWRLQMYPAEFSHVREFNALAMVRLITCVLLPMVAAGIA